MKHTEGIGLDKGWIISGETNEKGDLFIWPDGDYSGGHAVAKICGEYGEQTKVNARLIAGAPKLLEAVLACRAYMLDPKASDVTGAKALALIEAALKKVRPQ